MSQRSQSIFRAILWIDYDQTAYLPNPDETNEAFPLLWCVGEAPAFFGPTWFPNLEIFYAFKRAGW